MSEYKTETTLLPETKDITVLMQQKAVTLESGLTIKTFFVREGNGDPFLVQVVGEDANLERDQSYTVVLRERKQTRVSDGRVFTEIQIAGAEKH